MAENQKVASEKIQNFFKETVDFAPISKITDVLEFPITGLKVVLPEFEEFFTEEAPSIRDLAQAKEPFLIEGIDPAETNKIAMVAEMLFWRITTLAELGIPKKKIVFFGLENAGKTSALTALSERYSTIKELLPTRGLKRQSVSVLGYDIMSYDMGGQKDYRESYFEKADMYFGSGADVIIYCIDIQDPKRYEESMVYFAKILETYEKFDLRPPVLTVFTKLDPDIVNDEKLNAERIKLIDKIENIAVRFDVGYTNSSIFERTSIETLFSLALKRISTSGGVIQEFLREFTKDIGARACALVSSTGLTYGTYGETHREEEMLKSSAAYLQNLYLFHVSQGLQKEEFYSLEYKRNNLHFVSEYISTGQSGLVYLWTLTQDLRSEIMGIAKFREEILPLIEIYL